MPASTLARPGNTAEQVEAAWQAVLRKNGLKKESRVGYSVGLAYPPDWGERTASLRPGDTTELQPGMCFHIQAGRLARRFRRRHLRILRRHRTRAANASATWRANSSSSTDRAPTEPAILRIPWTAIPFPKPR